MKSGRVVRKSIAPVELIPLEEATLRSVYEKLQRQYRAYLDDVGGLRVSEGWDNPPGNEPPPPRLPWENARGV